MTFEMDDDVKRVAQNRMGNHTLLQWLSWCIWRTMNGFEGMPIHPRRLENFVANQISGVDDNGEWPTRRVTDLKDYL